MARASNKKLPLASKRKPRGKGQTTGANELKINFDYLKSSNFRVIRADGVHGGLTPKGNAIQMALFSERNPIPQREIFSIKEGNLGEREGLQVRPAVVREVEVEAIMDLETAENVIKWLEEKIQILRNVAKTKQNE